MNTSRHARTEQSAATAEARANARSTRETPSIPDSLTAAADKHGAWRPATRPGSATAPSGRAGCPGRGRHTPSPHDQEVAAMQVIDPIKAAQIAYNTVRCGTDPHWADLDHTTRAVLIELALNDPAAVAAATFTLTAAELGD
ncbi:hypothetical protein FOS14_22110 [Skermania sp. ID1734]|uniref:hypothetical protein n=1 Tax=Skermania sp. ID1734 TaxID=2597516 RepID=UPI00117E6DEF|nr:hypothetical protein [Skermania sp. ID1734]TSD93759.1 hypothetical protein FOS14_22110 [Skermania sp. ID1734]